MFTYMRLESFNGYFQDDKRLNNLTSPREQQVLNQEICNKLITDVLDDFNLT